MAPLNKRLRFPADASDNALRADGVPYLWKKKATKPKADR